ncbi:MAG: DUF4386 domain-containing protein [Chloroflexota bacterium]|nr:DUF4386 domain-containing protein [Chloroflexota bacterium]
MSEQTASGVVLIAVPLLFNAGFTMLAQRFDYPDILRRSTHEVLERFRAGGTALVLIWWLFALSAILFSPLAVLLAIAVQDAGRAVVILGAVFGVLASLVQFLGLIRWSFLVPYLARVASEAGPDSPRGQAVDVVFQAYNRYLGVAVGEHLGYAFTGIWSVLAGVALADSTVAPDWLSIIGVVIGPLFLLCSLEFVGRAEGSGWKLAGALTPVTYIAWSVWLLAVGVAMLA